MKMFIALQVAFIGFVLFGCKAKPNNNNDNMLNLLSGQYAKLWVLKSEDTLDCHCYYELLFKSGRMRHVRRDAKTGVFVDYFNKLSGDVTNDNHSWMYNNDTLSLIGFKYRIIGVAENKDTVMIESLHTNGIRKRYFLVDTKLFDK